MLLKTAYPASYKRGPCYLGMLVLRLIKKADHFARLSLQFSIIDGLPLSPYVISALYTRYLRLTPFHKDIIVSRLTSHLKLPWRTDHCASRHCEVCITRMRCRILKLNFSFVPHWLLSFSTCPYCSEPASISHFSLTYRRIGRLRRRPLDTIIELIHTFHCGKLTFLRTLFHCFVSGAVLNAVHQYITESKRLEC